MKFAQFILIFTSFGIFRTHFGVKQALGYWPIWPTLVYLPSDVQCILCDILTI